MTELPGNRETAYRVFAAEFDDATVDYQEGDEERAPNYVVTPTGARANRLFVVGVLTEIESVNDDVLRARIVDPTGAFVVYAGQYQPDEMAALERLDPPAFVAVTGKARTFQPDDSDRVFTSIRPESINTVDAATRDRWVVRTAEHTVDRVRTLAAAAELDATGDDRRAALAERGVPAPTASGAALALEHYGTTPAYLADVFDLAVDAAAVVAGDRDEVESHDLAPADVGDEAHTYADLATDLGDGDAGPSTAATPAATAAADAGDATASDADAGDATASDADAGDATASDVDSSDATTTDDATASGPATEPPEADAAADTADAAADTADATADSESTSESDVEASASAADDTTTTETATEPAAEASTGDDVADATVTAEAPAAAGSDADAAEVDATASDDADADADDDGVGDFEAGSLSGESDATGDQMYEFDEEERQEIEDEFGTEFSSGNDVPEPEESDLDAPDAADPDAADAADAADPDAADAADAADPDAADASDAAEGAAAETDAGGDESVEDVDLDAFVMDAMRDLDDGDGVARDALLDHVSGETGAETDAVEDAVQDALMGGQCYEPEDGVLKPI